MEEEGRAVDESAAAGRSERFAGLADAVPILRLLPSYPRRRLRVDVLAGAMVAALLIPQSLGYARIADVPVEVGLYAVPLALLAYAVLGSWPQLIVGPRRPWPSCPGRSSPTSRVTTPRML
jgi:hypothetical protein